MNGKLAKDIPIRLSVWKGDRVQEEVWSKNIITWSYNAPYIRQIQVKDHPTNGNQMIVTLIGNNFGNIEDGKNDGKDDDRNDLIGIKNDVQDCHLRLRILFTMKSN